MMLSEYCVSMMKRMAVKILGRVQGVFFRHAARLRAEELGLAGFARNENDGSVTIIAEGEEEALAKFLEWCRKGPPLARVDEVKVEWQEAREELSGFKIQ